MDILAETVMPSLYGPKPVVAEAGASAFGAVETAVAAGVAFTSAAFDPTATCCGPAGVATVTVPDFAGDVALAPTPVVPEAAPVAVIPGAGATVGASGFGAVETAAAAGAGVTAAAEDVDETVCGPAGVATVVGVTALIGWMAEG